MNDIDMKNPFSEVNRKKAMKSPEQLKDNLQVTSVSTLLITITIIMLFGAFVVWGFLGRVSDKAYYTGVIFPKQGAVNIQLPNKGRVRTMLVNKGDRIKLGQPVALVSLDDSYSIITSTIEGVVISTKMNNEPFEAFESIVSVVNQHADEASEQVVLIAFTDNDNQRELRKGMAAQIWPNNESRDEIGYIRGQIVNIGRYPVSNEEIRHLLKNDEMTEFLLNVGGMPSKLK